MSYLDNDHELYKVVKRKLPNQKKTLEGFKKRQKVVIDLLNENRIRLSQNIAVFLAHFAQYPNAEAWPRFGSKDTWRSY